jgi:basic membrane protein A
VEAYVSGFRAGMKTAASIRRQSLETMVASAGSFNDPTKGKSLAQSLIRQYADVIFRCAGNTGLGVVEAVREADGVYLITADLDLDAEMPGKVLTSALKRMDTAVYGALRSIVKGEFKSGHHWLDAEDNAIDITEMKYSQDQFTQEDRQRIQKARALLKGGTLIIPKNQSQVDAFEPPEL